MAELSVLLTAPIDFNVIADPGANLAAAAVQAAPAAQQGQGAAAQTNIITGISFSASGAVAAAVLVQLVSDLGGGSPRVMWKGYLPAAGFAPVDINFKNPIPADPGKSVTLTVPALGAGVSATSQIRGFTRFLD